MEKKIIKYNNPYLESYLGKDKDLLRSWIAEHEKMLLQNVKKPDIHATIELKLNALRVALVL